MVGQLWTAATRGDSEQVDALELHADRRSRGVPTVSVLRGPLAAGIGRFCEWAGRNALRVHAAPCDPDIDLVTRWLMSFGESPSQQAAPGTSASSAPRDQLRDEALEVIARAVGTAPEVVGELVDSHSRDAVVVLRRAAVVGQREALACTLLGRPMFAIDEPVVAFAEFAAGLSGLALLAVLDQMTERTAAQLRLVTRLVERCPQLVVGVSLTEATSAALLGDRSERWQALLWEGLVPVASATEVPPPPGVSPVARAVRDELVALGASVATIEAFDAIATASSAGQSRSSYETFLYGIVSQHPETVGFFTLNQQLGFKFGRRLAEVDICSRLLGIAIEIDGPYHEDESAQHRDRRKQELLERHGYEVLRIKTNEIVNGLAGVMGRISSSVRERKRALWGHRFGRTY